MERYRKDGNFYCIDLKFNDYKQLYDGRDPAPFRERDLDENLARYLIMSYEEIHHKSNVKIVLRKTDSTSKEQEQDFIVAIHSYFSHESYKVEYEMKQLFKLGRMSLLFGLLFLIICVVVATRIIGADTIIHEALNEGLIIMGWVALWRPINIFLYEWWPLLKKRKIYEELSKIKIEFNLT